MCRSAGHENARRAVRGLAAPLPGLPELRYPLHDRDVLVTACGRIYDLGYIDLKQKTLQPLDNPFGPRLNPIIEIARPVRLST